MTTASWQGVVIAESDDTVVVEGNHYFPAESVRAEYLRPSATTTVCGWKGTANYYALEVDGRTNPDAAWFYAEPKPEAVHVRGRVAFWRGVQITESAPAAGSVPASESVEAGASGEAAE